MIVDSTVQALGFALDGLTEQQQVIANNIANQDTPGFTASQVDFQSSLQSALSDGTSATITTTASPTPAGPNGNNVVIADQMSAAQQNSLQYQAVVEALTNAFSLQKTAQDTAF